MKVWNIFVEYTFLMILMFALIVNLAIDSCSEYLHANAGENSYKNTTIILDAGHGGEDCGAIGINGVYEKDLNLAICFYLKNYFEMAGCSVVLTRTEDKMLYKNDENIYGQRKLYDLKNRLLIADKYTNAIFVSIHMNSFPIGKYRGLQVWYQKGSTLSQKIAENVQKLNKQYLQPTNQRLIKAADESMFLLHQSKLPTILIESGFLSNSDECEEMCQKNYQKQLSFIIFCAILEEMEY